MYGHRGEGYQNPGIAPVAKAIKVGAGKKFPSGPSFLSGSAFERLPRQFHLRLRPFAFLAPPREILDGFPAFWSEFLHHFFFS